MIELPRDLPILERDAVRLVVRDSEDRILLLHTHEITTVIAVALDDSENGADERGRWPVLALTDEAHPIVFECNLN